MKMENLLKAVTRGNGTVGEVITNNARVFKNIPLKIPYTGQSWSCEGKPSLLILILKRSMTRSKM